MAPTHPLRQGLACNLRFAHFSLMCCVCDRDLFSFRRSGTRFGTRVKRVLRRFCRLVFAARHIWDTARIAAARCATAAKMKFSSSRKPGCVAQSWAHYVHLRQGLGLPLRPSYFLDTTRNFPSHPFPTWNLGLREVFTEHYVKLCELFHESSRL